MKKLTFTFDEAESVVKMIKGINEISCRIQLDLIGKKAIVQDIDDCDIEKVLDLFCESLKISSIDIDNIAESDNDPESDNNDETAQSKAHEKIEQEKQNNLPIQYDDSTTEPIEHIDSIINKLKKTVYWAVDKRSAKPKVVGAFIWSALNEISCAYKEETVNFAVGDVVTCNYGLHFDGESNGYNVPVIVCNIKNGIPYVVPIVAEKMLEPQLNFLSVTFEDFLYKKFDEEFTIVALDKGRYVNSKRFVGVSGKATPEFMERLLSQLPGTFNFIEDNSKKQQAKQLGSGVGSGESALLEVIGDNLEKLLQNDSEVEMQVELFLKDIDFPVDEDKIVKSAFVTACDTEKISFENVICQLNNIYPQMNGEKIKKVMQTAFKNWNMYPQVAEKCSRISIISLLKLFVKARNKD